MQIHSVNSNIAHIILKSFNQQAAQPWADTRKCTLEFTTN